MHPHTIDLAPADGILLLSILPDLLLMGYLVEDFGNNSFIVQGVPADIANGTEVKTILEIIEQYKLSNTEAKIEPREKLMRTIAWQQALTVANVLSPLEIKNLCEQLFIGTQPEYTPRGQKVFVSISDADLENYFKNG